MLNYLVPISSREEKKQAYNNESLGPVNTKSIKYENFNYKKGAVINIKIMNIHKEN